MKRLLKSTAVYLLLVTAISVFGYGIYLDSYFAFHAPSKPSPNTDQIYSAWFHHGSHVYITQGQYYWTYYAVPLIFVSCAIAASLLDSKWKVFKTQYRPSELTRKYLKM